MKELSVIIPIYNEEKSIESTIEIIRNALLPSGTEWEIIAVNDGSTDKSGDILMNIKGITVLKNKTNKGYGYSIKKALRHARYMNICIADADKTYPLERIAELFHTYITQDLDMLVGSRTGEDVTYPLIKKIPKFFIMKLANYIASANISDLNSGFRIFKKEIAMKFFHLFPNGFSFTTTITLCMLCGDYEVDWVPINYYKRKGKSKIRPFSDTIGFFRVIMQIAFYFNPFKFFSPVIFVFAVFSLAILLIDIIYLRGITKGAIFFPVLTLLFFTLGLLADLIIKRTQ